MTRGGDGVPCIRAHAHGKVNLDLRILSTRDDGYHEVATVLQSLALHDTLTIRAEPGPFRLACSMPGVPVDESNLVSRAARALWVAAGRAGAPVDVAVVLEKQIPAQAGLGGGSADAAAPLAALNRLWALDWSTARLGEVGATLGADVPFFLLGGTAEGRGRGDRLRSLPDLPTHEVLVIVPGFGVSTAGAYRWYDEDAPAGSTPGEWPVEPSGWAASFARCRNDLEPPVAARHPEIAEVLREVRPGARLAAMSGSGSAVFAMFDEQAPLAAAAAQAAGLGWRVLRTATIGRDAYRRSLLPGA
jgi:4-diphosphocytidyl-2-C-methyl-D-erythritol kinase